MAASMQIEKVDRPELAKHDSSILDLVFVMDCTGSMGSYIDSAKNNIRTIVEEIVVSEKSDIHLALVEYRDHPPQDATFVTRVHDFTGKVSEMKGWLDNCAAVGGGDRPEAVADGLHDVLKLSWRADSTKICVLISDAPPHGLDPNGDGFPNGCPAGLDPLKIVRKMAEKHITLYAVGVEPSIIPYRDFFMSLAYITGGQYVPMVNAKLLAKVIIGGVREEISLDRLMKDAQADIDREMQQAEAEGVNEKEKIKRMNNIFVSKNIHSTQMKNSYGAMSSVATDCYSKSFDMNEMRSKFSSISVAGSNPFTFGTPPAPSTGSIFGMPPATSTGSMFGMPPPTSTGSMFGMPPATSTGSMFGMPPATSTGSMFGMPPATSTGSMFGMPPATSTGSMFGMPPPTSTGSMFDMPPATSTGSMFGMPPATSTGSMFGMPPATSTGSMFGMPPPTSTGSMFDMPPATSTGSMFGMPPPTSTGSIFGPPAAVSTGFTFGAPSAAVSSFTSTVSTAEPTYDIVEDENVSEDQAARMYQKWQNRKK